MKHIWTKTRNVLLKINKSKLRKLIYDIFLVILIPSITIMHNKISSKRELIQDINSIMIGESYEYVKECFGAPLFQYKDEPSGIDEKIFDNKYAIIRTYFKNDQLIGFFVTGKKDSLIVRMPKRYEEYCNKKPLGKFSFEEIDGTPKEVYSYFQNGTGHIFYSEKYWTNAEGNYYTFCYMYLDYGFDKTVFSQEKFLSDSELEKLNLPEHLGGSICLDRKNSFPNTYGIIDEEEDTVLDLLSVYHNFDLETLRFQ